MGKRSTHTVRAAGVGALLLAIGLAAPANATEGAASFYVLGTGGPGAALLPPVPGVFLANTAYYYSGKAEGGREFVVGGNVVAGLDATIAADFLTFLSVPEGKIAGGTVAFGPIIAFGQPKVDVSATLTGPRGQQLTLQRDDKAFVLGDPALMAAIGWKSGKLNFEITNLLNIPIGRYREGELANLSFNRWANDLSGAITWHDDDSGWDVSAKTGFTFNGENPATDYKTGTEWHIEGAVEKIFSPALSLGIQGYNFQQLSGDSGPGAKLGDFKGRVSGAGLTGAYNFMIAGKIPASLRLHGIKEFGARNRLEGYSVFLDFSMPLYVKLPPGAPG